MFRIILTYFDRVALPSLCIDEVHCHTKVGICGERTTPDVRCCCNTTGRGESLLDPINH